MTLQSMWNKEEILFAIWKRFPNFLVVCDLDCDLCEHEQVSNCIYLLSIDYF